LTGAKEVISGKEKGEDFLEEGVTGVEGTAPEGAEEVVPSGSFEEEGVDEPGLLEEGAINLTNILC
jgi:hypothetical protein